MKNDKKVRIDKFKDLFDSSESLGDILLSVISVIQDYDQSKLTQFETFKLLKYGLNDSKGIKF